jgi:predicted nucleic acid-binding protein
MISQFFARAIELANQIGFKDFNDYLHTAIAEQYCTDFYTYNREDFKKIQNHAVLNIHIL